MRICLEERLRSESAFNFGILVVQDLSIRQQRSLHGLSCGQGARSVVTELSPVVAVVANEVSNLAEGFIRDNVLQGHGDYSN